MTESWEVNATGWKCKDRETQSKPRVKHSILGNFSAHKHTGCETANNEYKSCLHTEANSRLIQSSY